MSSKLKKVWKLFSGFVQLLILFLIISALLLALLSRPQGLYGYRAFVLFSGSMSPTMPVNSLVIVHPQAQYQKDDVITFYTHDQNGNVQPLPTTHRIFEIKSGDNLGFQTKGDGNQDPDPNITPVTSVIGKVIFHLPYFGSFSEFSHSRNGLTYLIVIPATIIAYQELVNLKNSVLDLIKRRRKVKKSNSK